MSDYAYYPGCSMGTTARSYQDSLDAITGPLGIDLHTIDDWNCCGATEYLGLSRLPAYALIARNLALAERTRDMADTVVASCSACFLNLSKANHAMAANPVLEAQVNEALAAGGLHYTPDSVKVRHLLDVIVHEVGLDTVRGRVVRPLRGLKLAPYLGCMVPRPDYDQRCSDPEHPHELDRLLGALGAEVIDFPMKTDCCGGHMTQISPSTAFGLIRHLVDGASSAGADMMVTICPMCQMNIDAFQGEMNAYFHTSYRMPIVFFTQIMGLAFGLSPEAAGFGRELVDARPALAHISEVPEGPGEPPRPRRAGRPKGPALPMPVMPDRQEVP
jgi:heterodisulfide reductase subunit B